MSLTLEEMALFGDPIPDSPAQAGTATDAKRDDFRHAVLIPTATPAADPGLPPPKRSKPRRMKVEDQPSCRSCGEVLVPENASERNGVWKHIGCTVTTTPAPTPAVETVAAVNAPPPYVPPPANPEYISTLKAAPVSVGPVKLDIPLSPERADKLTAIDRELAKHIARALRAAAAVLEE